MIIETFRKSATVPASRKFLLMSLVFMRSSYLDAASADIFSTSYSHVRERVGWRRKKPVSSLDMRGCRKVMLTSVA